MLLTYRHFNLIFFLLFSEDQVLTISTERQPGGDWRFCTKYCMSLSSLQDRGVLTDREDYLTLSCVCSGGFRHINLQLRPNLCNPLSINLIIYCLQQTHQEGSYHHSTHSWKNSTFQSITHIHSTYAYYCCWNSKMSVICILPLSYSLAPCL